MTRNHHTTPPSHTEPLHVRASGNRARQTTKPRSKTTRGKRPCSGPSHYPTAQDIAEWFLEGTTLPRRNSLDKQHIRPSLTARLPSYLPETPVLFLSGGPGAGKSTVSANLAELLHSAVVSLDLLYDCTGCDTSVPPAEWERRRILEAASLIVPLLMEDGYHVVVEGVLPPHLVEVPYRVLSSLGVRFNLVYLRVPVDVALSRNASRERVLSDWHVRSVHEHFSCLDSSYCVPWHDGVERVVLDVYRSWCDQSHVSEVAS